MRLIILILVTVFAVGLAAALLMSGQIDTSSSNKGLFLILLFVAALALLPILLLTLPAA